MKKVDTLKYITSVLTLLLLLSNCQTKDKVDENLRITEKLAALEGVEFITESGDSLYRQTFKLMIEQPLDHNNPNGEKFMQKVYISHLDLTKPVVFAIDGYGANSNRIFELSKFVDANQVYVEHRFFGESKPENYDWNCLNIEQAAADHHRIIELLKKIYKGKWLSTGISKGGQTTIFHRYFYPNDVDISVPYVAPLNFSAQEPRVFDFLKKVGTKECRSKIIKFQTLLLESKDKLMSEFKTNAEKKGYTFNLLGGIEKAYEYAVLEYTFAFWQWQYSNCKEIPENIDNPTQIVEHLEKVDCVSFFTDETANFFRPFFYQALTEIGMYTYNTEPFAGLLEFAQKPNFNFTMPAGYEAKFNDTLMQSINKWLQNESENFIYIYGEYDPWSAPAVQLIDGKTNALKMVKSKGSHRTRIVSFYEDQQKQIADSLSKWLGE
ncbi:MAG: S28 family serine protease [Bacteroidota bacterium]